MRGRRPFRTGAAGATVRHPRRPEYAVARRLVAALLLLLPAPLAAQAPPDWAGTWRGTLQNLPARPDAPRVDVEMELGAFPVADSACAPWRTTYREGGTVRQVKDYRLCRGRGPEDLVVDEGDGVRLPARWLGDVLVSPFKYGSTLLVVTTRVRGDELVEEIVTAADRPATDAIVGLEARGVQRLVLRRVPAR